jgi:hypothetical protein
LTTDIAADFSCLWSSEDRQRLRLLQRKGLANRDFDHLVELAAKLPECSAF